MKTFITDDFLLQSQTAKTLYHDYAKDMPIFDYHCHLIPQQIADDVQFENLTQIWLDGDHYKWRAMRSNGVSEKHCTGNASDYEKFQAWVEEKEGKISAKVAGLEKSQADAKAKALEVEAKINEERTASVQEAENAAIKAKADAKDAEAAANSEEVEEEAPQTIDDVQAAAQEEGKTE